MHRRGRYVQAFLLRVHVHQYHGAYGQEIPVHVRRRAISAPPMGQRRRHLYSALGVMQKSQKVVALRAPFLHLISSALEARQSHSKRKSFLRTVEPTLSFCRWMEGVSHDGIRAEEHPG